MADNYFTKFHKENPYEVAADRKFRFQGVSDLSYGQMEQISFYMDKGVKPSEMRDYLNPKIPAEETGTILNEIASGYGNEDKIYDYAKKGLRDGKLQALSKAMYTGMEQKKVDRLAKDFRYDQMSYLVERHAAGKDIPDYMMNKDMSARSMNLVGSAVDYANRERSLGRQTNVDPSVFAHPYCSEYQMAAAFDLQKKGFDAKPVASKMLDFTQVDVLKSGIEQGYDVSRAANRKIRPEEMSNYFSKTSDKFSDRFYGYVARATGQSVDSIKDNIDKTRPNLFDRMRMRANTVGMSVADGIEATSEKFMDSQAAVSQGFSDMRDKYYDAKMNAVNGLARLRLNADHMFGKIRETKNKFMESGLSWAKQKLDQSKAASQDARVASTDRYLNSMMQNASMRMSDATRSADRNINGRSSRQRFNDNAMNISDKIRQNSADSLASFMKSREEERSKDVDMGFAKASGDMSQSYGPSMGFQL